jgi:hypothetical protein
MRKRSLLVVLTITLLVVLPACAEPEAETVEVTREVPVPQTVEVTREVTKIVQQTVEVEVVVTPTPTPLPPATATPERTTEDWQSEIGEAIVSDLEGWDDVQRVNLVRWSEEGVEIELHTVWASRDNQPEVSWDIITVLSEVWADMTEGQRVTLTGSEDFTMRLTTYSTDGDYRYVSETDFDTFVKVNNRSMGYEEWVQAANAGFR